MKDFEIGYTPNNLKKILTDGKISEADARALIGKAERTFDRYLYAADDPRNVTMKHQDWGTLLAHYQKLN